MIATNGNSKNTFPSKKTWDRTKFLSDLGSAGQTAHTPAVWPVLWRKLCAFQTSAIFPISFIGAKFGCKHHHVVAEFHAARSTTSHRVRERRGEGESQEWMSRGYEVAQWARLGHVEDDGLEATLWARGGVERTTVKKWWRDKKKWRYKVNGANRGSLLERVFPDGQNLFLRAVAPRCLWRSIISRAGSLTAQENRSS